MGTQRFRLLSFESLQSALMGIDDAGQLGHGSGKGGNTGDHSILALDQAGLTFDQSTYLLADLGELRGELLLRFLEFDNVAIQPP